MKKLMEHYYIKEGFAEMDFDAVTRLLAATHWSHGISRAEVEKASSNSSWSLVYLMKRMSRSDSPALSPTRPVLRILWM